MLRVRWGWEVGWEVGWAEAAEVTEHFDFNCLPCIPASCIPQVIHARVIDPVNSLQVAMNDSCTQLGYCGVSLSFMYVCLPKQP